VLSPDDPAWREALRHVRHDMYHLPGYQTFAARHQEAGDPRAIVVDGDLGMLFVPIILRQVPGVEPDVNDAVSSRFYPGPLLTDRSGDGSFGRHAMDRFRQALADMGVISAYLRLHPLLLPPLDLLRDIGDVVDHMAAVSVDLTRPLAEQWTAIDGNVRREIARAERQGYQVRIDDHWQRLPDLVTLYEASMERLGAREHWRFDRGYFEDLRGSLGDDVHLFVVEIGDECAGAALVAEVDGIVNYHLAATADAHMRASPSKQIIDLARRWGTEHGDRVLYLGASPARDDGLFRFKARFSATTHPVLSWRLIINPERYRALTDARRGSTWPASRPDADAFFPAYRTGS
jgi:hypothetical protein